MLNSAWFNPPKMLYTYVKLQKVKLEFLLKIIVYYKKNLMTKLIVNILLSVRSSIFIENRDHMFDNDVKSNHLVNLVKMISFYYCNLRL